MHIFVIGIYCKGALQEINRFRIFTSLAIGPAELVAGIKGMLLVCRQSLQFLQHGGLITACFVKFRQNLTGIGIVTIFRQQIPRNLQMYDRAVGVLVFIKEDTQLKMGLKITRLCLNAFTQGLRKGFSAWRLGCFSFCCQFLLMKILVNINIYPVDPVFESRNKTLFK